MKNIVYKIENVTNGKCYVGSSSDFNRRRSQHLFLLRNNKHHSIYLQRSYNKHGEGKFVFSILEFDIPEDQLIVREQYFLELLQPKYNLSPVLATRKGSKHKPESIEKMRQSQKGHKVSDSYRKILSDRLKGNKIQIGNTNRRKVTPEIIRQVEELRTTGLGCRKIAAILNLNKTTILNIFNKKFNYG